MAVDFAAEEAATLARWRKIKAFETQVELSKGNKPYTFYDGPVSPPVAPEFASGDLQSTVSQAWMHMLRLAVLRLETLLPTAAVFIIPSKPSSNTSIAIRNRTATLWAFARIYDQGHHTKILVYERLLCGTPFRLGYARRADRI